MYWSRVKTILIILFLCLDIFLFGYIIYSDFDETVIENEEILNTVSILEKNNIKISEDIIPETVGTAGIVEMDSLWTDSQAFAETMIGGGAKKISENVFLSADKKIEIYDNSFLYKKDGSAFDESQDVEAACRELSKLHIYAEEADMKAGGDFLEFTQKIDGKNIFETGITVKTAGGKIAEIDGYWIYSNLKDNMVKKRGAVLTPVTSVLINFISSSAYDKNGDEIVKIEDGYSIGSLIPDTTHKLVSVVPAYKITLKTGAYAVYDGINGDLLYEIY